MSTSYLGICLPQTPWVARPGSYTHSVTRRRGMGKLSGLFQFTWIWKRFWKWNCWALATTEYGTMLQEMEERQVTQDLRASDWKEDGAMTESGDSEQERRKIGRFIWSSHRISTWNCVSGAQDGCLRLRFQYHQPRRRGHVHIWEWMGHKPGWWQGSHTSVLKAFHISTHTPYTCKVFCGLAHLSLYTFDSPSP